MQSKHCTRLEPATTLYTQIKKPLDAFQCLLACLIAQPALADLNIFSSLSLSLSFLNTKLNFLEYTNIHDFWQDEFTLTLTLSEFQKLLHPSSKALNLCMMYKLHASARAYVKLIKKMYNSINKLYKIVYTKVIN